ncbi:hypothetical protein [Dongia sp.]|uniref:hypothetical protein n=1 Tax=Dongia sp. TaxID=1977262 RepID=UPI0035B2E6C6
MNEVSQAPAPRRGLPARLGRRNIGYIVFMAVLVPLALLLEANGPGGPDSGGGIMFGIIAWGLISLGFFGINLILLFRDLARGQPAGKALIACALPVAIILGTLLAEEIMMGGS